MTVFSDLSRLTEAVYQADLAQLRRLRHAENAVRETLADLDRQMRENLEMSLEAGADWRATGADQAWRKWLMRQRADANMQLARIMARKGDAMARLKTSFARNQVSAELAEQQKAEARRRVNSVG